MQSLVSALFFFIEISLKNLQWLKFQFVFCFFYYSLDCPVSLSMPLSTNFLTVLVFTTVLGLLTSPVMSLMALESLGLSLMWSDIFDYSWLQTLNRISTPFPPGLANVLDQINIPLYLISNHDTEITKATRLSIPIPIEKLTGIHTRWLSLIALLPTLFLLQLSKINYFQGSK